MASMLALACLPAAAQEIAEAAGRETLSLTLSDAYAVGLQSVWMLPLATVLVPRVEAEWRNLSLSIGFVREGRYDVLSSGGIFTAEVGAGMAVGPWKPRIGLGLAMAAYNPDIGIHGDLLGEYLAIVPLRYVVAFAKGFSIEASALEVRYGPILPGPLPDWMNAGDFFCLADLIRIGVRMDLDLGGGK